MHFNKNPFVAGNWVRGKDFYGRSRLIHDILEGNRDFLWVVGTRRFGKTSLLKQLEWLTDARSTKNDFVPLFWDMQGSSTREELRESLLESVEDAEERFVDLSVSVQALEEMDFLSILRELRRRTKAANLRFLILCDEVEALITIEKNSPETLPQLRRFFQRGENVRTIITATKRLQLLETGKDMDTSPFLYGFVPPVFLTPLEENESRQLLAKGLFSEHDIETIIRKTNSHPYLIQLIARRLFENRGLNEVIEEIVFDDMISNFFSMDFNYLNDFERELLLGLLECESKTLDCLKEVVAKPSQPLLKSLYELQQLGFINHSENSFTIANYFFKQWLAREKENLFSRSRIRKSIGGASLDLKSDWLQSPLPKPGDECAGHEIIEKIGSGGMGVVYKALDLNLDRVVALKILLPEFSRDDEFKKRFLTEARAAATMNHPNIVITFQVGSTNNIHFIAMEYIDGKGLKQWRATTRNLATRVAVAQQAASALMHAHSHQIIHRDIKSDNILVDSQNQVKIMDFGLAKTLRKTNSSLTRTGDTLGTLAYMSPEQASGLKVDHRADIFSFGVVLYELFAGSLPFTGDYELSVMYAILNEEPAPLTVANPDIPQAIEKVVMKSMQKDKEKRYQSMAALYEAMAGLAV